MHVWQVLLVAAAFLATLRSVVSIQPFNSYSLALQWPPSVCDPTPWGRERVDDQPERFTIHGLRPQRSNGGPVYPPDAECNNNLIPAEELDILLEREPFYDDLKEFWPNPFEDSTYSSFWSSQWNQHGICSDFQNDPVGYFRTGLNLFTEGFIHLREDVGIEVGESYTLDQVHTNLKEKCGVHPQIACNKRNQLWEIRFCYRRVHGEAPVDIVDCPELSDAEYICDENEVHLPHAPEPEPGTPPPSPPSPSPSSSSPTSPSTPSASSSSTGIVQGAFRNII